MHTHISSDRTGRLLSIRHGGGAFPQKSRMPFFYFLKSNFAIGVAQQVTEKRLNLALREPPFDGSMCTRAHDNPYKINSQIISFYL